MIAIRARLQGESEWTLVTIDSMEQEDEDMESRLANIVTSGLARSSRLRVQILNGAGEWEYVE